MAALQSEISITLPGGEAVALDIRTACRLVRAIVDEKNRGLAAKQTYKDAYLAAWERLQAPGLDLEFPEPSRLEKFISKPYARVPTGEAAFLKALFEHSFFSGLSDSWIRSAIERLRRSAQTQIPRPTFWGNLLGVKPESQQWLSSLAGEYLLLRRLFTVPNFQVSFLTIDRARKPNEPLQFRTHGAVGPFGGDEPFVEGLVWAQADTNIVFCVGRVDGRGEVRSSILRPIDKPVGRALGRAPPQRDLAGIRLGLGRFDKQPRAYRIWCSRVMTPPPEGDWRNAIGEYPLDEMPGRFGSHILGLDWIMSWLAKEHYVMLRHPDDPTY